MYNITITGQAGKDGEIRQTSTGKDVATVSVAVYCGNDANGEALTKWFKLTGWSFLAEKVGNVAKGQKIVATGQAGIEKYTNKNGEEITVDTINLSQLEIMN